MATTQKTASPKKSQGFTGVRGAFWIIVVCAIIAFTLFFTWFGHGSHFQDGDSANHPLDIWGTIFKGGIIVPVIHTLLLTVIAMSIERWLALKTAFGKGALPKFVANIKAALNANDFAKAQQLCDAQKGSVANVVGASLRAFDDDDAPDEGCRRSGGRLRPEGKSSGTHRRGPGDPGVRRLDRRRRLQRKRERVRRRRQRTRGELAVISLSFSFATAVKKAAPTPLAPTRLLRFQTARSVNSADVLFCFSLFDVDRLQRNFVERHEAKRNGEHL